MMVAETSFFCDNFLTFCILTGGMELVTSEKKWQKIADDMGYCQANKNIANLLKAHYERILYPLDIFEREEEKKNQAMKEEMVRNHLNILIPF